MDRLLRDAAGQIDLLTYDATGALTDVDTTNAPTITVLDSAGIATAAFTPSRTGTGTYKATLPANLEVLDTYSATWNFANGQTRRTAFELVGGFLFTVADLRAFDAALTVGAYPTARVLEVRSAVEDVFEDVKITNRAFRPRGRRLILDGSGGELLTVPDYDIRSIVSATVDGTSVLSGVNILGPSRQLSLDTGVWTWGAQTVSLLYEYGMASPPMLVRRAAMQLAKSYLVASPFEEGRATAVFGDFGGYRLSIAGRDGWTGLPSVDAVLQQYALVSSVVG